MTARAVVLIGALAITVPAASKGLRVTPDLGGAGWKVLGFPGKAETRFVGRADGVIEVTAVNSVALLYREVPAADRGVRYLSWRWRVDNTTAPTDLSRKGHDDRPLALHIWFRDDPRDGDLWRRMRRGVMAGLFGVPLTGKVVTYVWGGIGRRGDRIVNPYIERDGVMYILRPGDAPTGRWFKERVDIAADFERAFGYPAPAPMYISVSADADDTESSSAALVADIMFSDGS